jgi:hypothetical protein
LLAMVGRERLISRNDVFLLQGTPVYWTLTRSNPVFEFAQSIVVHASARLKLLQQFSLLRGIWIDSVGVVHCQHRVTSPQLVHSGKCLSHPHQGESTSAGSPWTPRTPQTLKR